MQEPYKKGVANHLGPESCADGRKVMGEALTGEDAGQPSSSEITTSACRPCPDKGKATPDVPKREERTDAAESETLSMRGHSMCENRETPEAPVAGGGAGRSEKAASRTSDMHVLGESDDSIVPAKRANKAGLSAVAESVEGRGSTKGNVLAVGRVPDTAPEDRVSIVWRACGKQHDGIRSRSSPPCFTMSPRNCSGTSFFQLKREACSGGGRGDLGRVRGGRSEGSASRPS